LQRRLSTRKFASINEVRDILRRAASLLSRSKIDQSAIVQQLVGIPFKLFSKPAMNLGVSLWIGVINENPLMESAVLAEIARSWEETVRWKKGVFSDKLQ
jgi:phosphatidylinositol 4-kinase